MSDNIIEKKEQKRKKKSKIERIKGGKRNIKMLDVNNE